MPDGRKLLQKRQMRHWCSNRLTFAFSTSIWRGLNLSVSYLLWRDIFKKCCHAKAFKIQNDPTRSASLINLFGLGRVVHFGPRWETRTPDILLPKGCWTLFSLVYSGFRRFLICFTYSLTLLSPLFPGVPAPYVVIYVVKNASRPVSGECSPVLDRKRFAFQIICIVTLRRVLCKWFLRRRQLKCWAAIDKELAGR